MQLADNRIVYSATDLVGFLECQHLARLERAAVHGHLRRPDRKDVVLDRISQRGIEHEQRFLQARRDEGLSVVEIPRHPDLLYPERRTRGRDETLAAMRAGPDVIFQAVLFDGDRFGYADFLIRVEQPSDLGAWSYEVWDTKLARSAKASAVLQLCLYSDMVTAMQGRQPDQMHLALGGVKREVVSFRVADYAAYYRLVAHEFEAFLEGDDIFPVAGTPEPVEHCHVCRWSLRCKDQWKREDDLSRVAGLSSRQRRALHEIDVTTRTGLSEPETPLLGHEDISREAFSRIQAQASIQVRGERAGTMLSERIEPARDPLGKPTPDAGLLMLPEPSPGDLFFDIEGDPLFASEEVDGIDYLFGVIEPGLPTPDGQPTFHDFWAIEQGTVTTGAESRAFERLIDFVMQRLEADPDLHIYHYAPYETTAVKRLAGRHGTREGEVDQLLRGHVFVDLYRAVRQGVRASVESYSIKKLEPLYDYNRGVELRNANESIVEFETWLELGEGEARAELLDQIKGYNKDDCLSTLYLRNWLEEQRTALLRDLGEDAFPRPTPSEPEENEDSDAQKEVNELANTLYPDTPESPETLEGEDRGRWLLAQLLNWHRREDKAFWWNFFRLLEELTDEERFEDSEPIAHTTLEDSWPDDSPRSRSNIYQFSFPPQDHSIKVGERPIDPITQKDVGEVVYLDDALGRIDIKRGRTRTRPEPTSLVPKNYINPSPKPASLPQLARWIIEHGIDASSDDAPNAEATDASAAKQDDLDAPDAVNLDANRAARDLLLRLPPRLGESAGQGEGQPLRHSGEDAQQAARRLVAALDRSYLPIQGPPGSGKSTVGAGMIVDCIERGQRVGVTANSHKVIGELLTKVDRIARERGGEVAIGQSSSDPPACKTARHFKKNAAAAAAFAAGDSLDVVGGTTWLWAREDMVESVDILFIDEAGQMSLADALASAPCATNLVLLGDPQQLDQPLQGAHPPGAERSVLAHVLHGEQVMPDHLGLFLDGTWRLHPDITAYTSEVFYDGRLRSHPGRERLDLTGSPPLTGTGIRFVPVRHKSRSSESPEEAEKLAALIPALLDTTPTYTDANGDTNPLGDQDILVITPYNAQVSAIREALADYPDFRVGTVDKFQGQEAPISIYSMATSSHADAPHGMEFLYSLNRLNVATSRAQCLAVVVASPDLMRVHCRTPRQMRLANAFARLIEYAREHGG